MKRARSRRVGKPNRNPLRKIISTERIQEGRFGAPDRFVEVLECGHRQPIKRDFFGETNAYRRRCRKCGQREGDQ